MVAAHVKEKGYAFQVALDPEGEAYRSYGVPATPTVVLVSEKGLVTWKSMGLSPSLELRLKSFL